VVHDKSQSVVQHIIDSLTVLQHRGQDAAGIVTSNEGRLEMQKDLGEVKDVFTQERVERLVGHMGIGHVRYPTAGGSCRAEAQPLYTNAPFGIALAHNGNLTNTTEIAESMKQEFRHINTNSDSELLLNVFAEELQRKRVRHISSDEIFDAVRSTMRRCKGGYATVMLINGVGLLGFRDPYGIRPLCVGESKKGTEAAHDYCVASESVAIDAIGYRLIGDVMPGEAVFADLNGQLYRQQCHTAPTCSPCLFEFVYFARPDSVLDGVSVYEARLNMGEKLAKKCLHLYPEECAEIDVVMPIPDTSRTSALQCAMFLKKPYREGFVKNRYIARTFIMPGQEKRRKSVRLKLNTCNREFAGKNVLLVDDSIVRGTTSLEIIQMAREAGAKKVWFASAAPAVRHPNVYGIDIPSPEELVAHERNDEDIAKVIGADKVVYNDLEELEDAVRMCERSNEGEAIPFDKFDASCFNGVYVTPEVTEEYMAALAAGRGGGRKDAMADKGNPEAKRVKR